MSHICIIDDREDLPAPPFLQEAVEKLGHTAVTVFAHGKTQEALREALERATADLFVAIQTVGFVAGEALSSSSLRSKPVAVLFYDDPVSTFLLFG